jgi:hypothetical protein
MPNKVLKLDPKDNVLIALADLQRGEPIRFDSQSYILESAVPMLPIGRYVASITSKRLLHIPSLGSRLADGLIAFSRFLDPVVSLKNSSTSCPLQIEKLGKEMIVRVGMGPAVEDDDNDIHRHAKLAFTAERDLLEGLDRDIDYIKVADKGSVGMDVKRKRKHRTSDCQAPILLVTNAD